MDFAILDEEAADAAGCVARAVDDGGVEEEGVG